MVSKGEQWWRLFLFSTESFKKSSLKALTRFSLPSACPHYDPALRSASVSALPTLTAWNSPPYHLGHKCPFLFCHVILPQINTGNQ